MPELTKKKRIFQIAKELNISHLEIMQFLEANGTPVESHMAPVTAEIYDDILMEFSKDKEQSERYRKEQARKNSHLLPRTFHPSSPTCKPGVVLMRQAPLKLKL